MIRSLFLLPLFSLRSSLQEKDDDVDDHHHSPLHSHDFPLPWFSFSPPLDSLLISSARALFYWHPHHNHHERREWMEYGNRKWLDFTMIIMTRRMMMVPLMVTVPKRCCCFRFQLGFPSPAAGSASVTGRPQFSWSWHWLNLTSKHDLFYRKREEFNTAMQTQCFFQCPDSTGFKGADAWIPNSIKESKQWKSQETLSGIREFEWA